MDTPPEALLLARLREGDEAAFCQVFEDYHGMLMRLAVAIVKSPSVAEEVVQDTWVAVIGALPTFEGRSTLRTWIARIAINRAKTRALRDGRTVSLSDVETATEPSVDASRFYSSGLFNQWPDRWSETPEALMSRREVREAIEAALADLPESQRVVVTLRDMEGWTSEEVCNALDVSESNQRVLLHRGRSRLRAVLERVHREGTRR